MLVLYVLGYFNRNKQNSYATLTFTNNILYLSYLCYVFLLLETDKWEVNGIWLHSHMRYLVNGAVSVDLT